MSYISNSPAIFMLPNEVHVRIFQLCVHQNHSPISLSHVCQLWRELAFATSSLWNIIYLDGRFIQRAQHHLSLARKQPLTIISSGPDYGWTQWSQSVRDEYEQILFSAAETSLLVHLNLKLHESIIGPMFKRGLSCSLSQLQHLTLDSQYRSGSFFELGYMPHLRHLSLSELAFDCKNFRDILSGCHLLEVLTLVTFSVHTCGRKPDPTVQLSRLKSLTMAFLIAEQQKVLMSLIVLPKHCTLHVVSVQTLVSNGIHQALHPTTVAMLQPILFTTVRLRSHSVIYAEAPRDSRCTFQLELPTVGYVRGIPWNALKLNGSDTALITLDFDSNAIETLDKKHTLKLLPQILPQIRSLVIRPCTLQGLATRNGQRMVELLATASHLETLVLEGVNLDTSAEAGLENVEAVRALASQMQSAKDLRVALQECETSQEGLDMLREVLPVDRLRHRCVCTPISYFSQ